MRKEINLKGWIPNEETINATERIIRKSAKEVDFISGDMGYAKFISQDGKAKRLYVKIIISHEPIV